MGELFRAFAGRWLTISEGFDHYLRQRFPELELQAEYRHMDAWCEANPHRKPRKNWPRFVVTWLIKEAKAKPVVGTEIRTGAPPSLPPGTVVNWEKVSQK